MSSEMYVCVYVSCGCAPCYIVDQISKLLYTLWEPIGPQIVHRSQKSSFVFQLANSCAICVGCILFPFGALQLKQTVGGHELEVKRGQCS